MVALYPMSKPTLNSNRLTLRSLGTDLQISGNIFTIKTLLKILGFNLIITHNMGSRSKPLPHLAWGMGTSLSATTTSYTLDKLAWRLENIIPQNCSTTYWIFLKCFVSRLKSALSRFISSMSLLLLRLNSSSSMVFSSYFSSCLFNAFCFLSLCFSGT